MKKIILLLSLINLYQFSFTQNFGIKSELGINPFFSLGGIVKINHFCIDIDYAYNGIISGGGTSAFSSQRSPIVYSKVGYEINIPKSDKISLSAAIGYYFQFFNAEIISNLSKYSQYGNDVNIVFNNFMFSSSFIYGFSDNIKFTGNLYYFLHQEETIWYNMPAGVKIGDGICSINGPGLNVGIIYFFN